MKVLQLISKLIWPLGISCTIIGAIFKITHWAGANELLLIGILSVTGGFILKVVLQEEKFRIDRTRGILNISGFVVMCGGLWMRLYHYAHANKVLILGIGMMMAAYFFRETKEEEKPPTLEEQIDEIGRENN